MAEPIEQIVRVSRAARFNKFFPIPENEELDGIVVGDIAKILIRREKSAIEVTYRIEKVK